MIAQSAQQCSTLWDNGEKEKEKKYKSGKSSLTGVHDGSDLHFLSWIEYTTSSDYFLPIDIAPNLQQLTKPQITRSKKRESSLKTEEAEWLNSKQAAQYLGVSCGTLRNMASNGKIPYSKLGRSNRYDRQELRRLLLASKRGVF